MTRDTRRDILWLAAFLAALGWSAWSPHDRYVWWLEVAPAIAAAVALVALYPRWRFTPLLVGLVWLHALVLLVGGHYTYAEMPLFNWLRDSFGLARNYYDRLGHVMQGLVPAMVAREILVRNGVVRPGGWLFLIVCCMALAVSALYELLEWWVAVASGTAADAFLATQGDVWDTQWDMFLALLGSIAAQLALARVHDRQLAALGAAPLRPFERRPATGRG